MGRYILDGSNWPFLLTCCWDDASNANKSHLFDYLLSSIPIAVRGKMTFVTNGTRWPTELDAGKFFKMYSKRGAADLKLVSGIAFTHDIDFDVCVHCSTQRQQLYVYGSDVFWSELGEFRYIKELLRAFPLFYGQMSGIPFQSYQSAARQIEYPVTDYNRQQFRMFQFYQDAHESWGIKNGIGNRGCNQLRRINFVYTYNILSESHLDAKVTSDGCSLRDWIAMDPERGDLEQVTNSNGIWHVAANRREAVVRSLWTTGLFPVASHFEIVKWDSYNNLPWLRAHRSVLDFIVGGHDGMAFTK